MDIKKIFMVFLMGIILINCASAMDWDDKKEFDKEFGNDLEKRDGVCQPQPCDCCNNISLKIKNFISTLIKAEHGYYICPQCGATAKKVNWKEYKQIKKKYNLYG